MDKLILALFGVVLASFLGITIIHALVVVTLNNQSTHGMATTGPPQSQEPAKSGSLTPEQEYLKVFIGGIGTLLGAFIGGSISLLVFWFGLRATTRNAFLDMIVSNDAYRPQLDEFLQSLDKYDPAKQETILKEIEENLRSPALAILLVRKPKLKSRLESAIKDSDLTKIKSLAGKIFSE